MNKKILFLTPEFPPSKLTGAIRPAKFAKYLSRLGWDVAILTFNHQDNAHLDLLEDLKNVRIETCGIPKKIIVNDMGVSYLFQAYKQAMQLAREIKPDYILVSMPTFMNSLLAWWIKKRFDIDYLLDYRDLWVGDPYPARGVKSKVFRMLSRLIEPLILRSAYLSYYVSSNMLNDQKHIYPFLDKKKTLVISTGYDYDDIAKILPSLKKNGYIAHIGNAGPDMNLNDLISIVKNKDVRKILAEKNLKFLFVGRMNHYIKDLLDETTQDFFKFENYLPHQKALQLMADSNGLLILGSNSNQRLNRKVFEYTALNNNIFYLGNIESPTAKIVEESGGKISSVQNQCENMIDYLNNLSDSQVNINFEYSKKNLVKKLVKTI